MHEACCQPQESSLSLIHLRAFALTVPAACSLPAWLTPTKEDTHGEGWFFLRMLSCLGVTSEPVAAILRPGGDLPDRC